MNWSNKFEYCTACGTTSVKHKGHGLCRHCFFKAYGKAHPDKIREYGRTARINYDKRCIGCGKLISYSSTNCKSCAIKIVANSEVGKRMRSIANIGRVRSLETRSKISLRRKGKTYDEIMGCETAKIKRESHSQKMKELVALGRHKGAFYKGIKFSEATLKKFSKRCSGEGNPMFGRSGSLAPNWKGGVSFEKYPRDFSDELKNMIKERDGYCMLCHMSFENIKKLHRKVHVHHVDYDKTNVLLENLITLCVCCHTLTNFNREKWVVFFQSLLNERYNYQYTKEQEIILDLVTSN